MLRQFELVERVKSYDPTADEDALNRTIRQFLKKVGVTSQREIEIAVREAVASGRLQGNEALPATATIEVAGVGLTVTIDGKIELA